MPCETSQDLTATLKQQTKALSHEQLELIRMLPSFRRFVILPQQNNISVLFQQLSIIYRHVDRLPGKVQKQLILEDKVLKVRLSK